MSVMFPRNQIRMKREGRGVWRVRQNKKGDDTRSFGGEEGGFKRLGGGGGGGAIQESWLLGWAGMMFFFIPFLDDDYYYYFVSNFGRNGCLNTSQVIFSLFFHHRFLICCFPSFWGSCFWLSTYLCPRWVWGIHIYIYILHIPCTASSASRPRLAPWSRPCQSIHIMYALPI